MDTRNDDADASTAEGGIYLSGRFGQVTRSTADQQLTDGVIVRGDATPEQFADAWSALLYEPAPVGLRWEFSVQEPGQRGTRGTVLPLPEALHALRTHVGARLYRRPVGDAEIVQPPFPRVQPVTWHPLTAAQVADWYRVLSEFSPSHFGVIARQGGAEHAPDDWKALARRATALGFAPADYALLALARKVTGDDLPPATDVELWADFPALIADGRTPTSALAEIGWRMNRSWPGPGGRAVPSDV